MEIESLFSTLANVLHEHTGMGYFVDLLLKSLFVLVLMVLASLFTRKLPASLRHLIWCVGFISLAFLPLFIGFLPKIQVPINTPETVSIVNIENIESTVKQGIVTLADNFNLTLGVVWEAFLGTYFALLAIQLLYLTLGLCKVISLSRSANPVENAFIRQQLENLVLDEGITVPVRLKKSSEVYSPVSWGLFSPEIILPEHAENWSEEKTRNVLIHELSHIQRLDWLTVLIVRFTSAVYWYNPLIWYAARKLDEEAEQACDDAVILNGRCHNEYASNLLEIASHARFGPLGNSVVQAIAGSFLGSRVFSILDTSKRRQNTEIDWVVRGLLMGCTVIAILASLRFVPLVNVTSIDPRASTAFSIIFIPKSEAAAYGEYLENLFNAEEDRRYNVTHHDQDERRVTDAASQDAPDDAGGLAASIGGQAVVTEEEQGPSLLEEYLSIIGQDDSSRSFEHFVNEYTSDLSRHVQAGIDLSNFGNDGNEAMQDAEPELVAIRKSEPEYPARALQRGLEGYSVVEYAIDSQGNVIDPIIVDSSPGTVFNRTSLRAIQNYRFKPPTVNGEAVNLEGRQTKFVYQIKSG